MKLPQQTTRRRLLWVMLLAVVALTCGAAGATLAVSDSNGFCASCHEMGPVTRGLKESAHRDAACLDCHGERGIWHAVGQKLASLRNVAAHIAGRGVGTDTQADVPDSRCRSCHRGPSMPSLSVMGTVEFRHKGHVGTGEARCVTCHRTVAHGPVALKHESGEIVVLAKQKTERACLVCHTGEDRLSCRECHVTAGHRPRGKCGRCHKRGDWVDDLKFEHKPRLGKKHAKLTCETCHAEGVQKKSLRCAVCHVSAHGGLTGCGRCHVMRNWKPVRFTHPKVGPHEPNGTVSVKCASCHLKGYTSASCSCHLRPVGHPAVQGAHAALTCRACHGSAVGGASAPGCVSCHKARHKGLTDCSACHDLSSWTVALSAHTGVPHAGGGGPRLDCAACHTRSYASASCSCHRGGRHRPQALRGAHATLSCARCHTNGYGSRPAGCSSCHRSPHKGPAGCARCHDTSSWTSAHFVHRTVRPHIPAQDPALACADCHRAGYTSASCSCHTSPSPTASPTAGVAPVESRVSAPLY